jgi:hypothetical protein
LWRLGIELAGEGRLATHEDCEEVRILLGRWLPGAAGQAYDATLQYASLCHVPPHGRGPSPLRGSGL